MRQDDQPYDYIQAGFDNFLSRSIDNLNQVNLDSSGPLSTSMRFDSAQVSGALGDILKVGRININGVDGQITVSDGSLNRIVMGRLPGGSQGFAVSKEGKDVLEVL